MIMVLLSGFSRKGESTAAQRFLIRVPVRGTTLYFRIVPGANCFDFVCLLNRLFDDDILLAVPVCTSWGRMTTVILLILPARPWSSSFSYFFQVSVRSYPQLVLWIVYCVALMLYLERDLAEI